MRFAFTGILVLALVSCTIRSRGGAKPELDAAPPASLNGYVISGPFSHENLTVFLVHAEEVSDEDMNVLTLEEALKEGVVKISEKGEGAQVNQLTVENTGDFPVYLQAGDTVKGGKQDRVIAVDFVLPPRSGKRPVRAFCVEPGRWSTRGSVGQSGQLEFSIAEAQVATNL